MVQGLFEEGPFFCREPSPLNPPPGALYTIMPGEGQQSFFGPSSNSPWTFPKASRHLPQIAPGPSPKHSYPVGRQYLKPFGPYEQGFRYCPTSFAYP